jgi:hypothetical protein
MTPAARWGFFIAKGISSLDSFEIGVGRGAELCRHKRTVQVLLFSIEQLYTLGKSVRFSSTDVLELGCQGGTGVLIWGFLGFIVSLK